MDHEGARTSSEHWKSQSSNSTESIPCCQWGFGLFAIWQLPIKTLTLFTVWIEMGSIVHSSESPLKFVWSSSNSIYHNVDSLSAGLHDRLQWHLPFRPPRYRRDCRPLVRPSTPSSFLFLVTNTFVLYFYILFYWGFGDSDALWRTIFFLLSPLSPSSSWLHFHFSPLLDRFWILSLILLCHYFFVILFISILEVIGALGGFHRSRDLERAPRPSSYHLLSFDDRNIDIYIIYIYNRKTYICRWKY